MRHAYLIIAHNEFEILQKLVDALDDPNNDFYFHIDRKVKKLPDISTSKGKAFFLEDRVDVRWGSVKQIASEFALFEAAAKQGPYDYYHVISGVHLPLKSPAEIHAYFASIKGCSVFDGIRKDTDYQETLKMHRYNLFLRNYSSRNKLLSRCSQMLWRSSIAIQKHLGITNNGGRLFFKAGNWASLTEEAVQYLISRKEAILKTYRYTFCGDEYFVPSELMASPLKDKLISDDKYLLHNISRSNASTFRLDEWDKLRGSGYLFARKFTAK